MAAWSVLVVSLDSAVAGPRCTEVGRAPPLNSVVANGVSILELLAGEDETLLVQRNALLVGI